VDLAPENKMTCQDDFCPVQRRKRSFTDSILDPHMTMSRSNMLFSQSFDKGFAEADLTHEPLMSVQALVASQMPHSLQSNNSLCTVVSWPEEFEHVGLAQEEPVSVQSLVDVHLARAAPSNCSVCTLERWPEPDVGAELPQEFPRFAQSFLGAGHATDISCTTQPVGAEQARSDNGLGLAPAPTDAPAAGQFYFVPVPFWNPYDVLAMAEAKLALAQALLVQVSEKQLPVGVVVASPGDSGASETLLGNREDTEGTPPSGVGFVPLDPETCTTVMLKNIPNDFTRDMFLELLHGQGLATRYDFVYLPFDFHRAAPAALGYAFVNLVSPQDVEFMRLRFQGFKNWNIASLKVCDVKWATRQGLSAQIDHYMNNPVMHDDIPDQFKPALFQDGLRSPFPVATKRIRPPRSRRGRHGNA